MRNEIAPYILCTLLQYDQSTGFLYWRERPLAAFAETQRRSASRNASWWNGRFAGKRACKSDCHRGYLRVCLFGDEYQAHRVIWAMMTGAWPEATIDHIDGDKSNNRLENLREATIAENNRNRSNFGQSKYRGVSWRSRQSCWIAAIKTNGETTFLGCFKDEIEAARAYDIAAISQHGLFAKINFSKADYEARILSALVQP